MKKDTHTRHELRDSNAIYLSGLSENSWNKRKNHPQCTEILFIYLLLFSIFLYVHCWNGSCLCRALFFGQINLWIEWKAIKMNSFRI